MKIIAIIPSRYSSSRLPGKPLVDILGKPMIWHVYNKVISSNIFDDVILAIDDGRVEKVCVEYNMHYLMTSSSAPTHIHRIHEVSKKIQSDFYVVICGDEPLIEKKSILEALPDFNTINNDFYVQGCCRYFDDPAEVIDPANIKVVTNDKNECVLLTRSPVPFPYKSSSFKYKKVVGIEIYTKKALDFFVNKEKGFLESIEDVTLQRFLENGLHIKYKLINSRSLSVDTQHDLDKVIEIMSKNHG